MTSSQCNVCFIVFNEETNIPKVLECGHSFCLKCLHTILQDQKICPKCSSSLSKSVKKYPTNFALLSMMKSSDGQNYPDLSDPNWKKGVKKELLTKKENLKILMKKRDSLMISISGEVDRTEKLLNSIKTLSEEDYVVKAEEYLKTVNTSLNCSCNPKLKDLLRLDHYKNVNHFLFDIAVRLQNDEKVFACKKIGDIGTWKYGRLSFSEDRLYIHNLSESEAEKGASLVLFQDLRSCINSSEKLMPFIKMDNQFLTFPLTEEPTMAAFRLIKFFTGEDGDKMLGREGRVSDYLRKDKAEAVDSETINVCRYYVPRAKCALVGGYEVTLHKRKDFKRKKNDVVLQCIRRKVVIKKIVNGRRVYYDVVGDLHKDCKVDFNQLKIANKICDCGISIQM